MSIHVFQSNKPPRSEKRITSPEPSNPCGSKRGTVDNEHRPTRRSTPSYSTTEGQFTPIPQPRNTGRQPGLNATDHVLHQIPPSPSTKPRNHPTDRYPTSPAGTLRNNVQTMPSPALGPRSSIQNRRVMSHESTGLSKVEMTSPNLSAHNAYYNPAQQNLSSVSNNTALRSQSSGTLKGNPLRPSQTDPQSDYDTVQTTHLPRKAVRELIEYDLGNKASGKCCVII